MARRAEAAPFASWAERTLAPYEAAGGVTPAAGGLSASRNEVLRRLPDDERRRLEAVAEPVRFAIDAAVGEPGRRIDQLVFLDRGFVSLVAGGGDEGDARVEVGMIGRESVIGFPAALGHPRGLQRAIAQQDCFGHAAPAALPMDDGFPTLRRLLGRCALLTMRQLEGSVYANARARLAQRLARWLLMAHDRVDGDELQVVHRFLSQMLGVRRAGVTEALHILEGDRLIRAERGRIVIRDREGLIRAAGWFYGERETRFADLLDA
jgi:CRP-like cAMP-binding protein